MAAPAPGCISVFSSPQELGASLAQLVAQRAASCVAGARARFALGLSGGSLVSMLARELPAAIAPAGPAGLAHWTLGFCDERLVPFEHAESTYGLYRTHLLSKLPIPDSQVITINPQLPVEDAAEDYARKLRQAFQGDSIPVFDLLILGVGPDGHTCSLFPDHPLLQEREKIVAPISDSPKPPPQRVTLTLPVLNAGGRQGSCSEAHFGGQGGQPAPCRPGAAPHREALLVPGRGRSPAPDRALREAFHVVAGPRGRRRPDHLRLRGAGIFLGLGPPLRCSRLHFEKPHGADGAWPPALPRSYKELWPSRCSSVVEPVERRHMHQEVAGSIPGWGICLGCGLDSQ